MSGRQGGHKRIPKLASHLDNKRALEIIEQQAVAALFDKRLDGSQALRVS
jgi:hypothetical protein